MDNNFLNKYQKKNELHTKSMEKRQGEAEKADQVISFEQSVGDTLEVVDTVDLNKGKWIKPTQSNDLLYDNDHEVEKNKKKMYLGIGIILLFIIITAIILWLTRGISMPDFTGWSKGDANLWGNQNGIMIRYVEEYDDDTTSDTILSQEVAEGEKLSKGEFLELTVSLGPDPSILVIVPDFMEMTKAQIDTWVVENHMTKTRVTSENSRTVEAGKVLTFTVNDENVAGTEVRRDSPIYIIISSGRGAGGTVTLPDFTQMTLEMAESFATDNEIELQIEEVFEENIAKGQVISQDVAMEEVVKIGDVIKLKVSKGPEIFVPNFASYTVEEAGVIASQKNIVTSMEERYSSAAQGKFVSQSIAAGSLYDGETIVKLCYSLGNKVMVQSYVGQGVDAIQSWADELNGQGCNITIKKTYTASDAGNDVILSQDKENKSIGITNTINLVVSQGKVVYVPDFVAPKGSGYDYAVTREKAIELCNEAGLVPIFKTKSDASRLEGEVVSQSISAGKEVKQGSTITLYYKPVSSTVVVPNLIGKSRQEVMVMNLGKSFNLSFNMSDLNSVIESQSLTPGSRVAPGTKLELTTGISGGDDMVE